MGRSPKAEVEVTASSHTLAAKLREARAKFAAFGSELKKNIFGKELVEKGFWGKAGATMVGNLASSGVQAGLGFVADQAKGVWSYNDALTRLQITAERTPEEMRAYSASVRVASDETGIGKDRILAASAAYVALTGDMAGAEKATGQWARVAQATNSNIDDIAKTAAALSQNSKVGPGDMEAAFAALAIQGKKGAIELKDLAAQMSTIAPQWAMFSGGTGVQGVKELGAALQVVKRGFGGDASETVTGLQSLLTAITKNAARFKGAGIKVFDVDPKTGAKTMRNVLSIVEDIGRSKLMKDPTALEHAFGRVEAYRAFLQLQQNKAALDDLVASSGDVGVIQRDLTTYLESDAGRVGKAWEKMKNAIADAFTPERIQMFVGAIESLAGALGPVIDRIGQVATALGNATRSINDITGVSDLRGYDAQDMLITSNSMIGDAARRGMSDSEIADRQQRARRNMTVVDDYNRTVQQIRSAQGDASKPTDAAVQRAVLAVYNPKSGPGFGSSGETEAGLKYLENAGIKHSDYVRDQLTRSGSSLGPDLLATMKGIQAALGVIASNPTNVKVGGDTVVKATREAKTNVTRPRG